MLKPPFDRRLVAAPVRLRLETGPGSRAVVPEGPAVMAAVVVATAATIAAALRFLVDAGMFAATVDVIGELGSWDAEAEPVKCRLVALLLRSVEVAVVPVLSD